MTAKTLKFGRFFLCLLSLMKMSSLLKLNSHATADNFCQIKFFLVLFKKITNICLVGALKVK